MMRLGMEVTDPTCCLCEVQSLETSQHLFVECNWIKGIHEELMLWTNIHLKMESMKQMLLDIKCKHWKKHKKEVIATTCEAMLYHNRRARSWKNFQHRTIKAEDVTSQIKEELVHKMEMLDSSKKAYNRKVCIRRLLCI